MFSLEQTLPSVLTFAFMGFLGGLAYVMLWRIKEGYEIARYLILGGIVGFVYFFLYTEHNFPNYIMAFVSGFASEPFLDKIIEWHRERG